MQRLTDLNSYLNSWVFFFFLTKRKYFLLDGKIRLRLIILGLDKLNHRLYNIATFSRLKKRSQKSRLLLMSRAERSDTLKRFRILLHSLVEDESVLNLCYCCTVVHYLQAQLRSEVYIHRMSL